MSASKSRNSPDKRKLKLRLFGGHSSRPCCFCGKALSTQTATLEHVVPLSKGVNWKIDNLRLSCRNCNQERQNEDFQTFRARRRKELVQ